MEAINARKSRRRAPRRNGFIWISIFRSHPVRGRIVRHSAGTKLPQIIDALVHSAHSPVDERVAEVLSADGFAVSPCRETTDGSGRLLQLICHLRPQL